MTFSDISSQKKGLGGRQVSPSLTFAPGYARGALLVILVDVCLVFCLARRGGATALVWSSIAAGGAPVVLVDEGSAEGSHTPSARRDRWCSDLPQPRPPRKRVSILPRTPYHVSLPPLNGGAPD